MFLKVPSIIPTIEFLTYEIPEGYSPVVGGRVVLPLGKQKEFVGVVWEIIEDVTDVDKSRIRSIIRVIDAEPLLNQELMENLLWASRYYLKPLKTVVEYALPSEVNKGKPIEAKPTPYWRLVKGADTSKVRGDKKNQLISILNESADWISAEDLNEVLKSWRPSMKSLLKEGIAEIDESSCFKNVVFEKPKNITLNDEQLTAIKAVNENSGFNVFLLQGVTGSGKTEVYIEIIRKALSENKQAFLMIPEIGLSPQTVKRIETALQERVAMYNSSLNASEKMCAYKSIKEGRARVLIGTRSACFFPFKELGVVLIDEEHDKSYKNNDSFYYSAKDFLIMRAKKIGVPVLMGSATPNMESLHKAKAGKFQFLEMTNRAGVAKEPKAVVQDTRGKTEYAGLTMETKCEIDQHLEDDNQVLIFLNKRGYASALFCMDCGWKTTCPNCHANMTYHKLKNEVRCHHCDNHYRVPRLCPDCGSHNIDQDGLGTEKLEEVLSSWYPDKKVLRIDRDATKRKGDLERLTTMAANKEADILIGTQMLAKGHHFPGLTLAVVLGIDGGLSSSDFRGAEFTAQLLLQVMGRPGRHEKEGSVIIQTKQPDNAQIKTLVEKGYNEFCDAELEGRKAAMLPPFSMLTMIRAESFNEREVIQFLTAFKDKLSQARLKISTQTGKSENKTMFLGPAVAPMEKREGKYRYQLLVHSVDSKLAKESIREVLPEVHGIASKLSRGLKWSVDVDPLFMD